MEIDGVIKLPYEGIPCTLESIPGTGPVYTAGLISGIGDVHRFDNEAGLAQYAGLVWYNHLSGKFEAENTHLFPCVNPFFRYNFCHAADKVRQHYPD